MDLINKYAENIEQELSEKIKNGITKKKQREIIQEYLSDFTSDYEAQELIGV